MLYSLIATLAVASTLVALSACGSTTKTSSNTAASSAATTSASNTVSTPVSSEEIRIDSGKPLSRAAWIAKADAVCLRTNIKLSSTTAKTQHDFARLLPQAAAYERAEATELSKLVPPPSMARDWQQIIIGIQKFGEFSARAGEYARVNNFSAALPIATAGNNAQREFTAIAKQDGFKVCSLP
jgi:hypothetical protein